MNKVKSKTGKRIPITAAQKIAEEFGYDQVIIHGYDSQTNMQCVTTYGKTIADCHNAANGGNVLKRLLGFPEEMCQDKPAKVKHKEKRDS